MVPSSDPSCMYSVRASSASSYSQRATTRRAIYSNTSGTPSPVLADVKKSLGPRSTGGGTAREGLSGSDDGDGGVVDAVVACARINRLGVIVGAEDVERSDGARRRMRSGESEGARDDVDEYADVGAGEARADSKASKKEEEGVW